MGGPLRQLRLQQVLQQGRRYRLLVALLLKQVLRQRGQQQLLVGPNLMWQRLLALLPVQ